MPKTKKCARCGKRKRMSAFGTRKQKGRTYIRSYCKPCRADYIREYRTDPKKMAKHKRADARRRQRLVELIRSKKNKPCSDCGGSFNHWQMDFHHRSDEEKLFDLGSVRRDGYGEENVLAEIAKCDLVCANCHRDRTWKEQHNGPLA